jgi:excinuclease UvrABC ATPase subunit
VTPGPHAADSHALIRVHGARVNNLKDVSVEIPKRRLTVFTGVSGSGKSSLVFGTIAAESQRLIRWRAPAIEARHPDDGEEGDRLRAREPTTGLHLADVEQLLGLLDGWSSQAGR